jgi:hypothetical protein
MVECARKANKGISRKIYFWEGFRKSLYQFDIILLPLPKTQEIETEWAYGKGSLGLSDKNTVGRWVSIRLHLQ